MSHEIFNQMFTERNTRLSAWHKLGTAFDPSRVVSVSTLTKELHADYEVQKTPVIVEVDGTQIPTGKFAITRGPIQANDDSPAFLDFCSNRWEPVQNLAIAQAFDKLSKNWPVETMGVLKNGQVFFFTLKGEDWSIPVNGKEDPISEYLFVANPHEADGSIQIGSGVTRVVCKNTLDAAIYGARFKLPLSHNTGANELVALVSKCLTEIVSTREAMRQALRNMSTMMISRATAREIWTQAWPEVPRPKLMNSVDGLTLAAQEAGVIDVVQNAINASESVSTRYSKAEAAWVDAQARREQWLAAADVSLDEMADGEGLGINAYTAVQAVIEVEQHRRDARGNTAENILFGNGRNNIQAAVNYALYGKVRGAGKN